MKYKEKVLSKIIIDFLKKHKYEILNKYIINDEIDYE